MSPSSASLRRLQRSAPIALLLFLGPLAACGDNTQDKTQPAPNSTTFEVGRFDDLPRPPRSDPLGPRTDEGGVVTRSYRVVGTSAEQVLDFYVRELPPRGWTASGPVEKLGNGTFRGTWTSGRNQLTVSSSRAPTLGQDDAAVEAESQYSLSVRVGTG